MRHVFALVGLLVASPAMAIDLNPVPPIEHVREAGYGGSQQRYPMTYSDEAAQSLGVKDGKWEAFSTTPSSALEPRLSAGANAGGAMLSLSWH